MLEDVFRCFTSVKVAKPQCKNTLQAFPSHTRHIISPVCLGGFWKPSKGRRPGGSWSDPRTNSTGSSWREEAKTLLRAPSGRLGWPQTPCGRISFQPPSSPISFFWSPAHDRGCWWERRSTGKQKDMPLGSAPSVRYNSPVGHIGTGWLIPAAPALHTPIVPSRELSPSPQNTCRLDEQTPMTPTTEVPLHSLPDLLFAAVTSDPPGLLFYSLIVSMFLSVVMCFDGYFSPHWKAIEPHPTFSDSWILTPLYTSLYKTENSSVCSVLRPRDISQANSSARSALPIFCPIGAFSSLSEECGCDWLSASFTSLVHREN